MEARINHRVTQKAENYGVACHRKFSTILSRLDGFQIQSSRERFIAILLKFYRVKFKGKKLPQRVIFNDIFNVRAPRTAFILPHIINEFIFQRILPSSLRANLYTRENARFIRFNLLLQQSRKVALMRL